MESTMSVQRKHRGTRSHTPPSFNQQQAKKKRPKKTTNSKIITIRRIKVAPAPVLRRGLARSTWFPPTYIIIVSEKAQLWDLILLPSPHVQVGHSEKIRAGRLVDCILIFPCLRSTIIVRLDYYFGGYSDSSGRTCWASRDDKGQVFSRPFGKEAER